MFTYKKMLIISQNFLNVSPGLSRSIDLESPGAHYRITNGTMMAMTPVQTTTMINRLYLTL